MRNTLLTLLVMLSLLSAQVAESFEFTDAQGKAQRLTDYRGKWVVVSFISMGCDDCEQQVVELGGLNNAHKGKDLVVLGIVINPPRNSLPQYAAARKIKYPVAVASFTTAQTQVPQLIELFSENVELPVSVIYNPAGKLATYQKGVMSMEDVEAYLLAVNQKK